MHILLDLLGLLIVIALCNVLLLRFLRVSREWSHRQVLQLLVLTTPLASLIVLIGGIQHAFNPACVLNAPVWDDLLDKMTLLLVGSSLIGAFSLGVGRLVLVKCVMREEAALPDAGLQMLVDHFSQQHGFPHPCVRIAHANRPFAVFYGIRRPTILLSDWMVEHLDSQELEAVLVHELVHVRRHHYLLNWIALVLRDAFFYLPTSRIAYRQFHYEKELVCDELVVQATRRPLALASALTKVWLYLVDDPPSTLMQTLIGRKESISDRVDRILDKKRSIVGKQSQRFSALSIGTYISVAVLNITVGMTLTMALLQC